MVVLEFTYLLPFNGCNSKYPAFILSNADLFFFFFITHKFAKVFPRYPIVIMGLCEICKDQFVVKFIVHLMISRLQRKSVLQGIHSETTEYE